MSKTIRSNTWACVFYPGDSAPVNYLDIINSFMLPVLLSPLHDPDKNNEVMDSDTGEFDLPDIFHLLYPVNNKRIQQKEI